MLSLQNEFAAYADDEFDRLIYLFTRIRNAAVHEGDPLQPVMDEDTQRRRCETLASKSRWYCVTPSACPPSSAASKRDLEQLSKTAHPARVRELPLRSGVLGPFLASQPAPLRR